MIRVLPALSVATDSVFLVLTKRKADSGDENDGEEIKRLKVLCLFGRSCLPFCDDFLATTVVIIVYFCCLRVDFPRTYWKTLRRACSWV